MKILIILAITVILVFFIMSFTAKAPTHIGLKNGQLAAVPDSPNCVSSFAQTSDTEHYISPLSFDTSAEEVKEKIKALLKLWPRTTLKTESENYLHYECSSFFFRFVDDLEIYIDGTAKQLHFRSASRVGHSDFGVNRKRVEELKLSLK